MVARVWIADVVLWEHTVAAVAWDETIRAARFEYAPSFLHSNIQIAPIMMPLGSNVYSFPSLARETYRGLPGLLSDCLPDRFGNALIDQWLSQQGRSGE